MECGIEIDPILTEDLELLGFPSTGTLVNYENQMFHIMGYNCWCWDFVLDLKHDPREFYDVILYHIGTGICSSFPYMKVIASATVFDNEDKDV